MRTNLQETAGLVTSTEDILNGKLHFLWSVLSRINKFMRGTSEREIFFP